MIPADLQTDPTVQKVTQRAAAWVARLQEAVVSASQVHAAGRPADLAGISSIVDEIHAGATPFDLVLVLHVIESVPCAVLRRRIWNCLAHRFARIELGHVIERREKFQSN